MKTVIRRMIGAAALAAGLAATGPALADMEAPKKQFLSLATSTVGGSWYPLGAAMSALIGKHYPQLNINTEVTGGTVDNLNLLKNKKVDLALSTNDQAYLASQGQGPFDGNKIENFKGMLGGHIIIWQLYTLKKTGITSIADLKGKRISLGAAGSIGNDIGPIVFEAHGLKSDDWRPEYIGHGDGPGALKDGRVDAVLIISSAPTAALTDITSTDGDNVVFINPDPAVLDKLIEKYPYWSRSEIPGGAYRGVDQTMEGTFGVSTILVAADSVDDATVYAITKTLIENQAELAAAHALGKEWTDKTATRGIKGVIPFHPGAEKYLTEKGLF